MKKDRKLEWEKKQEKRQKEQNKNTRQMHRHRDDCTQVHKERNPINTQNCKP